MDLDPWLVSGDLVETDELWARKVVARLIIADEIRVKILRKVRTPHRWAEPVNESETAVVRI